MREKKAPIAPFGLRIPQPTRKWVEAKAREQDRSMNYVILRIIENAIENEKSGTPA